MCLADGSVQPSDSYTIRFKPDEYPEQHFQITGLRAKNNNLFFTFSTPETRPLFEAEPPLFGRSKVNIAFRGAEVGLHHHNSLTSNPPKSKTSPLAVLLLSTVS